MRVLADSVQYSRIVLADSVQYSRIAYSLSEHSSTLEVSTGHCPRVRKDKRNNMSKEREKGTGNKRARVTRGSQNPKHGKRALHCG
jgi:hypothetical protein